MTKNLIVTKKKKKKKKKAITTTCIKGGREMSSLDYTIFTK